ncbi:MAG TPA: enoyl-CoA hydratase/isomerase family protein [Solirubrobacterales bacterium]|nr:enoyl-CoA hydratase/isomerase family protein [Solirubrobacterales bacterium]
MAHLNLTERDGVSVLSADRPPANAMDVTLLDELVGAVEGLAAEPPAALVLAGRPGFFSAGLDLKAVPGYGPPEQRRLVDGINRMAIGVYGLPCPVVCAITGHAIAGGFVLAVCGDHRVASTEGRYGLTEIKVGVPYPQGAIGVVRAELTAPAARLLVLGSRLVDAAECVRLGAFDEALPPDQVVDRSLEVARELAELPAEVYARTKAELRGAILTDLRAAAEADPLLASWV